MPQRKLVKSFPNQQATFIPFSRVFASLFYYTFETKSARMVAVRTYFMNKKKFQCFLVLLSVTVLFTLCVMFLDKKPIGPMNTVVGLATLNQLFLDRFTYQPLCYFISQALGYLSLLVCIGFAAIGLLQLVRKKSLWKVDPAIIALGGLYVVTLVLYVLFEKFPVNYRPILQANQVFPEPSFPSSHAMLAIVVYASAPKVINRYFKDRSVQLAISVACYLLASITVLTRLFSQVHWLTDIIAGVFISLTLLNGFFLIVDALEKRRKKNTSK